ncbi:MAG TPA: acyclic terpene utilization AtuA family protein, partial [Bryobacteraceae bacterium]|nr:acyclic terpene utilization AtuA family protein [Bryobacteraceae bacterium]
GDSQNTPPSPDREAGDLPPTSMIRIANGQGFWGDWLEAPVRLVEQGPIDYLVLDYLAEVTMSILQKQRQADPKLGYARDFPPLLGRIEKLMRDRNVKVIANAGGVNPIACAQEVRRLAPSLKIAVVLGDDVLSRLDEFLAQKQEMRNMDTGAPLSTVRPRILSANAYIGAFPLSEALDTGADVVIAGRCTDTALTLAPMIHRYDWKADDWNKLAAGTIAGHIVECGSQCTGGNCQVDWQQIPDLANIGYPIVDAEPDGTFAITKHPGTGGRVTLDSIKEQLLYELGDPKNYITPDCVADFTSIKLKSDSPDRVRVSGIQGSARPAMLKLSISYADGYRTVGSLVYSAPQALEKARAADAIVRDRLKQLDLHFDEIHTEFFGVNACHGPVAAPNPMPPEVQLRMGVRGQDRKALERFTRELAPLALSGPPTGTGFGEGRPPVREVVAFWPALIPRELIQTRVEVIE